MVAAPDQDLVEGLRAALTDQPDVVAAYLFGSHARGVARPASDVDVAVLFDRPPAPDRRLSLLADLATAACGRRPDLVVLNDAPAALAYRVLRDGVLLVASDDVRRIRHHVHTLDRYFDMAPARRTLAAGTRHRIQEGRFGRP